jgi:PKD repeat protein
VTVTDDDGGSHTAGTAITVRNVAPGVEAGPDRTIDEGDLFSLEEATFSDPGSLDTHTASIDWGDGSQEAASLKDGRFSGSHLYPDNGVFQVTLAASDDDGASTSDDLTVTVKNVAPGVEAGPDQFILLEAPASFSGSFSDPGSLDTHHILWDFGDGETLTGTLTPGHTFTETGVYTVTLTVTDNDGASGSDQLIVTVNRSHFSLYLPAAMSPGLPDLVGSFRLDPGRKTFSAGEPVAITVEVTNQGKAPAQGFWVDFYINPSSPPTAANMGWHELCTLKPCYGISWFVEAELAPGESITLTSTAGSYAPDHTIWPGSFAGGTSDLYLYVDSWNPYAGTGAVAESHESNNRAELHGLQVSGSSQAAAWQVPLKLSSSTRSGSGRTIR